MGAGRTSHSFSNHILSKDFYVGYGWYRKSLKLTLNELSRKIFHEFDGVFQEAEFLLTESWPNKHVGGYTGFSIDISSLVKAGDNILGLIIIGNPNVAPRAGEHVFQQWDL